MSIPKNIGSIGVDKWSFPSLFTDSSINQDLLFSENVNISCTELLAGENKNIAPCPVFGCLKVTISGVPVPVYCSGTSNASPIKIKILCFLQFLFQFKILVRFFQLIYRSSINILPFNKNTQLFVVFWILLFTHFFGDAFTRGIFNKIIDQIDILH